MLKDKILQRNFMNKIKYILVVFFIFNVITNAQQNGGVLRYYETDNPTTFDPISSVDDMPNVRLSKLLFEPLFKLNKELKPIPNLVKSYNLSKNNNELHITLRNDIFWSTGDKITSNDIIQSYNVILTCIMQ
jgi:peptide/nickel transport system substrate-binding protein